MTVSYQSHLGWNYYNDNDGTYTLCDSWADARASVKGMSHDHQVVFTDQHGKEHYVEDGLNLVESIVVNNKTLVFATHGTTTKEQLSKKLSKKLYEIASRPSYKFEPSKELTQLDNTINKRRNNMNKSNPSTYGLDITPVPDRCIHTGRRGAGIYKGIIKGTKAEVEKWCEALKKDYHPAGYGTTTEVRKGLKTNTWYAQYSRQGSCD